MICGERNIDSISLRLVNYSQKCQIKEKYDEDQTWKVFSIVIVFQYKESSCFIFEENFGCKGQKFCWVNLEWFKSNLTWLSGSETFNPHGDIFICSKTSYNLDKPNLESLNKKKIIKTLLLKEKPKLKRSL